ncbi:formyltetrahydrofolate deformylase [Acaryochloris marina NIES-2412]|uniref:formyltetrahydrofolate deformylase n=1 Tax=Acaryochloris marina TaxID=155978 RepID=UPI004058EA6F
MSAPTATLLISCPDQKGLVAKIAHFIAIHHGNIIHADHHTDFTHQLFLSRLEWSLEGFQLSRSQIGTQFSELAESLQANWQLHFSDRKPRMSIWVSKQDHCLLDLLWRQQAGDLPVEIPLIISNHDALQPIAEQFNIDFYHLPVNKESKARQEKQQLALLKQYNIDLVVLAKYMQILSPQFIAAFSSTINIHHSFLPAFPGANPYQRAYKRGVKIIGATAHYVTEDLDEGPIIEQEVVRVSHRDSSDEFIRKGKDVERSVLARAVRLHLQNRVLVYNHRTVVFD